MKSTISLSLSPLVILALIILSTPQVAEAGCRTYWEGTAPFCNSSCPSGCRGTGTFSNSGDGGNCWSGKKQLCTCCGPKIQDQGPCRPTQTDTKCKWGVMICENVMLTGIPSEPKRSCGSYACGVCFG
ncbi:hypothetical protein BZA77DRAFT_321976 [Pyronema omphalodes]|nr:hypothetical protein BZA77DRAFT_321976 [Pyronema omphalodes]